MRTETAAGIVLIFVPAWFNVWFVALARRFDYPDILRRPTAEILERFRAGGPSLVLVWWAFMLSGLAFVAASTLLGLVLEPEAPALSALAIVTGALAGLVQVLGLLRWVYLVPLLARLHGDPGASDASRGATEVAFRAFHHYLGVGVGEHLGYLLTGAWTILVGAAVVAGGPIPAWLGWIAIPLGALFVVSSAEFLGPNEERGWPLAAVVVPLVYVAWSLWLAAVGIALLV
jgi:hypothetical protein